MDDRQLLEAAARAGLGSTSIPDQAKNMVAKGWSSLDSDGDAFRLLVKRRMTLELSTAHATVHHPDLAEPVTVAFKAVDMGEYEGARLAVTRAAAALGSNVKPELDDE